MRAILALAVLLLLAAAPAAVREVWVEQRATGRGAMIGGGIGAGALMPFGYVVVRGMCEGEPCTDDLVLVLPLGALAGGTAGGLLGGGIGYLTKASERRYPWLGSSRRGPPAPFPRIHLPSCAPRSSSPRSCSWPPTPPPRRRRTRRPWVPRSPASAPARG